MKETCHDCGVEEGQLHILGCDNEVCPRCGLQLISCDCVKSDTSYRLLKRLKYIQRHNICARCGEIDPEFFMVSDAEWERNVPTNMRKDVLCRECYSVIWNLMT